MLARKTAFSFCSLKLFIGFTYFVRIYSGYPIDEYKGCENIFLCMLCIHHGTFSPVKGIKETSMNMNFETTEPSKITKKGVGDEVS